MWYTVSTVSGSVYGSFQPMTSDVQGGSPAGGHSSQDRRSSERVETKRDVLFSDYEATGPIRVGLAVDMSAGGFRITTRHPETLGTEIQIELQPKPDDQNGVVLFRGRIVHIEEMDDGQYAMGIRLLQRAPLRAAGPSRGLLPLAAKAAASDAEGDRSQPRPVAARGESDSSTPRRVVFSKIEPRKRKRRKWLPWGTVLFLFIVLCAMLLKAIPDDDTRFPRSLFGAKFVGAVSNIEQDVEPRLEGRSGAGRSNSGLSGEELRSVDAYAWNARDGIDALLLRAQAALGQGDLEDAEALFKKLEAHPEALLIHRFASLLGYAETAASRGERSLARSMVRRAQKLGANVPQAWQNEAKDLESKLNEGPAVAFRAVPMDSMIVMNGATQGREAAGPLRIEVNVSEYLLTVLKGGEVLRSFPIGLGAGGSTPMGTFRIANKISDPDWYRRGVVVPAGAEGNPLGASWMGLGDGTSASSYGIHPTADAGSIGQSQSQGCVRMRPEDAEALFRLVPIGTQVVIRP